MCPLILLNADISATFLKQPSPALQNHQVFGLKQSSEFVDRKLGILSLMLRPLSDPMPIIHNEFTHGLPGVV